MPQLVDPALPTHHGRPIGVAPDRPRTAEVHPLCAPAQGRAPHVLQVFEPCTGGVPRYADNLARGLAARGWRVSVACPPQAQVREALLAAGIDVTPIEVRRSLQPALDARAVLALARWCRDHDVSVLHGHSTKAGMLVALAGARAKVPSVYTPHGWAFERRVQPAMRVSYAFLERQLAHRYHAAVVTVSDAGRAVAERWRVAPRGRIQVVPTGLPASPAVDGPAARELLGIPPDALVVGWVGRAGLQKQPHHLVGLANRLRGFAQVVALCDGLAGTALSAELKDAGIQLLECACEPAAVYAASDLLVHTSAWEASPLVVLEAMAAGLPVVAYDVGGVREQIRSGRTGYLVRPGDIESMGECVRTLGRDPVLRAEIAEQARSAIASTFSYSSMLDGIGQVYMAVAGSRGAVRQTVSRRLPRPSPSPVGVGDLTS